jgi:hypothetical protein
MTRRKKLSVQIFAYLALFWIIIWIIWTWLLFITWGWTTSNSETISYEELQKLIDSWAFSWELLEKSSWSIDSSTWDLLESSTWSMDTSTWEVTE